MSFALFHNANPEPSLSGGSVHLPRANVSKEKHERMLLAQEACVTSLEELRELVYQTLCIYDQLEPGIFSMTERILVRNNEPCGIHFCLHGPRRVKYTSIWETDGNTILFYGSTGERFHKTQLIDAPQLNNTEAKSD